MSELTAEQTGDLCRCGHLRRDHDIDGACQRPHCWVASDLDPCTEFRVARPSLDTEALQRVLALADEFDAQVPWPNSWIGNRIREAVGVEK